MWRQMSEYAQGTQLVVPQTGNCKELHNINQQDFLPDPPGQAAISLTGEEIDL